MTGTLPRFLAIRSDQVPDLAIAANVLHILRMSSVFGFGVYAFAGALTVRTSGTNDFGYELKFVRDWHKLLPSPREVLTVHLCMKG